MVRHFKLRIFILQPYKNFPFAEEIFLRKCWLNMNDLNNSYLNKKENFLANNFIDKKKSDRL
jgi:hypothetical protein